MVPFRLSSEEELAVQGGSRCPTKRIRTRFPAPSLDTTSQSVNLAATVAIVVIRHGRNPLSPTADIGMLTNTTHLSEQVFRLEESSMLRVMLLMLLMLLLCHAVRCLCIYQIIQSAQQLRGAEWQCNEYWPIGHFVFVAIDIRWRQIFEFVFITPASCEWTITYYATVCWSVYRQRSSLSTGLLGVAQFVLLRVDGGRSGRHGILLLRVGLLNDDNV